MDRNQEFPKPPEEFPQGSEFASSRRPTRSSLVNTGTTTEYAENRAHETRIDVKEYIHEPDLEGANRRRGNIRQSKAEASSRINRTDSRISGQRSKPKSASGSGAGGTSQGSRHSGGRLCICRKYRKHS